jgi:hypothetical protein
MAITQADIDALIAAIADGRGARTITFGDQSVTFETIDEMQKRLAWMRGELATSSGAAQTRSRVAAFCKGV